MEHENKCDETFDTQKCYVNGNLTSIEIYAEKYTGIKKNNLNLKCKKGHELLFVNSEKINKYFRHKNKEDCVGYDMTEWHIEWQNEFNKKYREVTFNKVEYSISDRRADICVDEIVVEFQHSRISSREVLYRTHDYLLHDKQLVWVVNGNGSFSVTSEGNKNVISLEKDLWKYNSFADSTDFIFIDVKFEDDELKSSKLYKIFLSEICNNMMSLCDPIDRSDFIDYVLNNNERLTKKHDKIPQCTLYVKQEGAGNGKTYGIIRQLQSLDFDKYTTVIMISKQHSAKDVILKELKDQEIRRKSGYDKEDPLKIKIIKKNTHNKNSEEEPLKISYEDGNKKIIGRKIKNKYVIDYKNPSEKICKLIIATVDSFMFANGDKNANGPDKFYAIANSIIAEEGASAYKSDIKYATENVTLNRNMCLILDETQDLLPIYGDVILKLMLLHNIDTYVVGDKLQSLAHEKNAFTYLRDDVPECPHIDMPHRYDKSFNPINNCRRFKNPKIKDFINGIIKFDQYSLPQINFPSDTKLDNYQNPITIFQGKTVYTNEKNEETINMQVDEIMERYEGEVKKSNRKPNDFLIIGPVVSINPLLEAVNIAVNKFWLKKYEDTDKGSNYRKYSFYHKSEDGAAINLTESENATRIVSIHSSKGDGRKVVFLIGFSESTLHVFSGLTDTLIYESLFHVALTRTIERLYIKLDSQKCDIGRRIISSYKKLDGVDPISDKFTPNLSISNNIPINRIKSQFENQQIYDIINEKIISKNNNLPRLGEEENSKKIIDMGHHNIRYIIMSELFNIRCILFYNKNKDTKKQTHAKLYAIINCDLDFDTDKWTKYNDYLEKNNKMSENIYEQKTLCIMKMSNKGNDYVRYHNIIVNFVKKVREKIRLFMEHVNKKYTDDSSDLEKYFPNFCVYEFIIMYYINGYVNDGKYTKLHITDLYEITHIYATKYNSEHNNNECLCKKYFDNNQNLNKKKSYSNDNDDITTYIHNHYNDIEKIKNCYDNFLKKSPKMAWLSNHFIKFKLDGDTYKDNDNYKIGQGYNFIGYDDKEIYVIYIKPELNTLNYEKTILYTLLDSYMFRYFTVYDISGEGINDKNNKEHRMKKFMNKKVKIIIMSTNMDPITIDWEEYLNKYQDLLKYVMVNEVVQYYMTYISEFYHHFNSVFFNYYEKSKQYGDSIIEYKKLIYEAEKGTFHNAQFIKKFLNDIEYENENGKDLSKYEDEEIFKQTIIKCIVRTVYSYFKYTTGDMNECILNIENNKNYIDELKKKYFSEEILDEHNTFQIDNPPEDVSIRTIHKNKK